MILKPAVFTLCYLCFSAFAWSQSDKQLAEAKADYLKTKDGINLYYETIGEGEPVLLVHGFIVNSASWKTSPLYADLISNGFKVIILDLRGNGKSDKPHTPEAYENDIEAKDIMHLMDHLHIDKYNVIGYSRGAIIASRLLILDKRVSQAVLGGMGAAFTDPEWPRRKLFYKALAGEPVPELEGLIQYVKDSGLNQQALAYMQHGQPSTSKQEFAKVNKPVLVICGSEDEDNGSSKDLAEMIPRSTYIRIPGNHNTTMTTQKFGQSVIAFLKSKL